MNFCFFTCIYLTVSLFTLSSSVAKSQQDTVAAENIRLNQIGFYPDAPKLAVVVGNVAADTFFLSSINQDDTVYTGVLSQPYASHFSQDTTRMADFSDFKMTGTYRVVIPSLGASYAFNIQPQVFRPLSKAAIKAFYYQRASTDLPASYAGIWKRAAGHPDTLVRIHASAVSEGRPKRAVIAAPKGWYDAGDYNKYIVNSGITMGTLMAAYEDFPAFFDTLQLNIPESDDQIPDMLNEVLWNLQWMLAMQDADGGVYHKLTTASFESMIKPETARHTRYVVQKSTAATLDFAAVMAQASRVFRKFDKQLPGLADSCLHVSQRAWQWAQKHPKVLYNQPRMNKTFKPKVTTGAYDDQQVSDEFNWAAAELYVTTGDTTYYQTFTKLTMRPMEVPSWNQVQMLGLYTLSRFEKRLNAAGKQDFAILKDSLIAFANHLTDSIGEQPYRTVMGQAAGDFVWGSNAVAANQSIALLQAYRLTSDHKYIDYALSNLDYLLGRNATGYSFVTGFGSKTPLHPHHRLSISDGIKAPVPGLLVGGPNPAQQDGCKYPTNVTDASYVDDDCSYASNEIAINWNAPLAYLAAALEALQYEASYAQQDN